MTGQIEEIKYINNLSSRPEESSDAFNLDELKRLNESVNYEVGPKQLTEQTLDDFDTAYESLRMGLEKELKNFIVKLLDNNIEMFMWSFVNPTTEVFKDVWSHILIKYTVSDASIRDQFLNRVRILLRNIFLEKFDIVNEEEALALADGYFTVFKVAVEQNLERMKPKDGQTIPVAQSASTDAIVYR
jgi:hypothetical protein